MNHIYTFILAALVVLLKDFNFYLQNGSTEEVKKIVASLNAAQVPSQDVVGECFVLT